MISTVNFYNEHDPKAAAWLRELIHHGHIPAGVVDERSIEDIIPSELSRYTQCHFFAGIGGWAIALRLAGWPEDKPVWTGSCPCQPFSTAGKGTGFADERHLWPAFHHLISQCQPAVVFGEQVASKDGLGWLDLVCADCEASGYAVGAVDLCAAGVGAPHIRQRLWWVADRIVQGLEGHRGHGHDRDESGRFGTGPVGSVAAGRAVDGVDCSAGSRRVWKVGDAEADSRNQARMRMPSAGVKVDGVADANGCGRAQHVIQPREGLRRSPSEGDTSERNWNHDRARNSHDGPSPLHGLWRDADWLHCRDGKWRPVEPGSFPLGHGLPARVVRLRGYGNAIVPQVAAEFIKAYLET